MARDRLESYAATAPTDVEALDLLGEVLFQMGDLPRAARYWMLTARNDALVDRATTALRERYPRARVRLEYLLLHSPLDGYPELARRRIDSLAAEAKREDGREMTLRSPSSSEPFRTPPWWEKPIFFGVIGLLLTALFAGSWWIVEQLIAIVTAIIG